MFACFHWYNRTIGIFRLIIRKYFHIEWSVVNVFCFSRVTCLLMFVHFTNHFRPPISRLQWRSNSDSCSNIIYEAIKYHFAIIRFCNSLVFSKGSNALNMTWATIISISKRKKKNYDTVSKCVGWLKCAINRSDAASAATAHSMSTYLVAQFLAIQTNTLSSYDWISSYEPYEHWTIYAISLSTFCRRQQQQQQ